ncbi:Dehydrogenase/reductase SDR family member 11 17-beta-hydroxysteroid dehydrogenase [Takifugu flavidus]|uniref:Dehydrogenase/reductase SDR family member 11 n=1 Tax=Takifugu flavidus TaxID=433684 RepID=A0A5C6P3I8_9TELE|nr:Dehydrogenase/reductase SDR family member 11 17-beta-hydroxysteroid dehydrogenase [Takifugu flavidus]
MRNLQQEAELNPISGCSLLLMLLLGAIDPLGASPARSTFTSPSLICLQPQLHMKGVMRITKTFTTGHMFQAGAEAPLEITVITWCCWAGLVLLGRSGAAGPVWCCWAGLVLCLFAVGVSRRSTGVVQQRSLVGPQWISLLVRRICQLVLKRAHGGQMVPSLEKLAAECQSAGYSGTLIPYKCDLSNEEEILSMFSAIKTMQQGVDVCINNAGLAHSEPLLSGKTEGWKNMIDVNVLALSICTREAYKSMKERNVDDGHIININSMGGHRMVPSADEHFYCATKYAVTALTEGIRQELREANTHIRATCISPGIVETEFAFRHHNSDPEKAAAVYESMKCLKAEDVASAVTFVLSAPPHVQIGDVQMRPVEQVS